MEEAFASWMTPPGKKVFIKNPSHLKKLFGKEEEKEQIYRQQAREYAKKLNDSFGDVVLCASIAAELNRMLDHMEFLKIGLEYWMKEQITLSAEEELRMVKDHLEFSAPKLLWVMEYYSESLRGINNVKVRMLSYRLEEVKGHMGAMLAELYMIPKDLPSLAIEVDDEEMVQLLESSTKMLLLHTEHSIEELQVILRYVEYSLMTREILRYVEDSLKTREIVDEWKTAEPLSRMAARLEFSPAELHMLKTDEFYRKQHSPKMERQPVSTDEKVTMVAPEKIIKQSSNEDLEKQRLPDESLEKDPRDISEKRESLYKEPERQKKLPSEAPELTEKSFVKAMEKQLQFWTGSIRFLYEELETATNGFRIICHQGSEMLSYEGTLLGRNVLIKRYTYYNKESLFLADVRAFSMLHHRNIAKGIGWCHHGGDLFIVEELMDEGRLCEYIGSDMPPLPWDVRFKIVHDVASAILYLHEGCYRRFIHQDINSANILLDSDYCAKLTSFRNLQFVYNDAESSGRGKRSDVYSFGIVVLEIATGQKADSYTPVWKRSDLVRWVHDLFFSSMDGIFKVADKRLKGEFNLSQMEKLISIGLCCTQAPGKQSPSMREVVEFLKYGTTLPTAEDTNAAFVSRTSSPRGHMSPPLHGEASLANETIGRREQPIIDDHMEQLILGDEAISATEDDDIGIPEDYNCSGPMNNTQVLVMQGFISTLYAKIEEGAERNQILQIIKSFTGTLVQLRFPISDWKPLAQYVLRVSRMIEDLRKTQDGDTYRTALSIIQKKMTQRLATIEEERAIGVSEENMTSTEQERPKPTSISTLEKQIVELRKIEEAMTRASLLTDDKIEVLNKSRIPKIEIIEYIEFAISILHESLLLQLSTFPLDGK